MHSKNVPRVNIPNVLAYGFLKLIFHSREYDFGKKIGLS